jgi:hypothetical protein
LSLASLDHLVLDAPGRECLAYHVDWKEKAMASDDSRSDHDGPEYERASNPPRTDSERRLRQWYYTAKRLQENGESESALYYFKRIYEIDYNYEDVAKIVEDSYLDTNN